MRSKEKGTEAEERREVQLVNLGLAYWEAMALLARVGLMRAKALQHEHRCCLPAQHDILFVSSEYCRSLLSDKANAQRVDTKISRCLCRCQSLCGGVY